LRRPTETRWLNRRPFIIVIVVFVFVQREAAIRAGIDAQFDGVGRFFGGVLDEWAHGNDGAGPDQQRDFINGRIGVDGLAAGKNFAGPKVQPLSSGGQINRPGLGRVSTVFSRQKFRGLPEKLCRKAPRV